jgi:hypothetical protein
MAPLSEEGADMVRMTGRNKGSIPDGATRFGRLRSYDGFRLKTVD